MIIYFNIDRRNLLSFTAILNFAVCWCEICNQEIFGAARISYNMLLHTRQAIGSSESFSTVQTPDISWLQISHHLTEKFEMAAKENKIHSSMK